MHERVKEIIVIYCVLMSQLNRHIVIHSKINKIYDACSSSCLITKINVATVDLTLVSLSLVHVARVVWFGWRHMVPDNFQ